VLILLLALLLAAGGPSLLTQASLPGSWEGSIDLPSAQLKIAVVFRADADGPAGALRKVNAPVYAAFGELDTQVPPAMHEAPLRRALAHNQRVTVVTYPGANHLFQQAKTGQVTEYATLPKAFVAKMPDDVAAWILGLGDTRL
jgi:fermentation-respiration switch protein FrsA (DUF1100 family)